MNVICIRPTKKLVKNATYKVAYLKNINTNYSAYFQPSLKIYLTDNSIHSFPLSSFKLVTGKDFPNIEWFSPEYSNDLNLIDQTKIDKNLKVGDYVVPIYDNLKTLVKDRKYKVKDINILAVKSKWGVSSWNNIKIKLEGSDRWYTSWNFKKCTSQEAREINLNSLFNESTETETVGKYKRKFDYYTPDEKVKLICKLVLISANDKFRNSMDIIDWTIEKSGDTYKLNRDDFNLIDGIKLVDFLKQL
jgi:hypothetical protein